MNIILSIISVFLICWVIGLTLYLIWVYKSYSDYKKTFLKEKGQMTQTLKDLKQEILDNNSIILELKTTKQALQNDIQNKNQLLDVLSEQKKESIDKELDLYKQLAETASQQYFSTLEQNYQKMEKQYDKRIEDIYKEYQEAENSLSSIRNSLIAGMKANLEEQAKQENIDFYKIKLTSMEIEDINQLNNLKSIFHQPTALSKIIWSVYCQKKVNDLCNRVCGNNTLCGIYKITNLKTSQVYIGQSVDIANRFKQHCKCGCGIDAPQSNKLYQSMSEHGLWNFTFEIVEECSRECLNEKERFWINFYQSDFYGLNSNKGISK